jgi:hypothetical protein
MAVENAGMPLWMWRDLAWSTPMLWSEISLLLDDCSPVDYELLEGWLARSGCSPLSIHLTLDGCAIDRQPAQNLCICLQKVVSVGVMSISTFRGRITSVLNLFEADCGFYP